MKFSIITCTFNSEPYLAQSIDSVLAQDYRDYEYIFVDGGSTDGTLERIRAIPRPFQLIENVRGTVPHCMNRGLAAASGEVIAHMHSDDYYLHPRVLSRVAEAMTRTGRHWAIGLCPYDYGGKLEYPRPRRFPHSYFNYYAARTTIAHPAVFVDREVWRKVGGFDERLNYSSDIDLWLRVVRKFEPVILDEPLAAFRAHAGSGSTRDLWRARSEELRLRLKYALFHPLAAALGLTRILVYYGRLALTQERV